MRKTNKTFKLDPNTIGIIQEVANLLGLSQAEVIAQAIEKAFGEENAERKYLMSVYGGAGNGIHYLQAIRDNHPDDFDGEELTNQQQMLHDFLNEVWEKARTMPQFPEWA